MSAPRHAPRMQRLGLVTALWLVLGCDVGQSANQPADPADAGGGTAAAGASATSAGAANATAGVSSGTAGNGTAGNAANPPKDADFKLLFRDDFDSFDVSRWQLM